MSDRIPLPYGTWPSLITPELVASEGVRYAELSFDGDELLCPLHASSFNVRTGQVLSPTCAEDLTVYPVTIEGENILVGPPA